MGKKKTGKKEYSKKATESQAADPAAATPPPLEATTRKVPILADDELAKAISQNEKRVEELLNMMEQRDELREKLDKLMEATSPFVIELQSIIDELEAGKITLNRVLGQRLKELCRRICEKYVR